MKRFLRKPNRMKFKLTKNYNQVQRRKINHSMKNPCFSQKYTENFKIAPQWHRFIENLEQIAPTRFSKLRRLTKRVFRSLRRLLVGLLRNSASHRIEAIYVIFGQNNLVPMRPKTGTDILNPMYTSVRSFPRCSVIPI